MLSTIIDRTTKYIDAMPKKERKRYGQFFTSKSTAEFMAGLFDISTMKNEINVLDPGAGSGILSCAFVERLSKDHIVKVINLTCYENDINVLPLLEENLSYMKSNSDIELKYTIVTDNYITSQYLDFNQLMGAKSNPKKYDYVIGNPPYLKIPKEAAEATAVPSICYGAPNLYFIFTAMSLFNLKEYGEMVYIIPRSWTSGAYFKRFREFFLTEGSLEHIHLFVSRDKVFDKEEVLQETMIIKVVKTEVKPEKVTITSSRSSNDFNELTSITVPYNLVVSGKDKYVYLVTNDDEINVLKQLEKWSHTLPDIGLRMRTGLTVDFRCRNMLRSEKVDGAVPLFYSQHIKNGIVKFPVQRK